MPAKLTPEQEIALKRAVVFKPCKTREHLQDWLREFLDVDLPDTTIDPTSNSNPMSLIWEVYEKAMDGHDEEFQRILAYASRDSYKSFAAAVLEVLMVVHLDRDVAHMAAQKPQAIRVQRYVKTFLSTPFLRPYVVAKNDSNISVVRYMDSNDMAISEKEWSKLSSSEQVKYRHKSYTIEIVVATVAGANSAHTSFMCVDGDTGVELPHSTGNRKRRSKNIRSVFNKLAGLKVVGRRSLKVQEPLSVDCQDKGPKVLSLNLETGGLEFKRVTHAHRSIAETVKINTQNSSLICTKDHPVFVLGRGFVEAGDLKAGDPLLFMNRAKTETRAKEATPAKKPQHAFVEAGEPWEQVLMGSLLGDGGVYRRPGNNAFFTEQHSLEQRSYLDWKRSIFNNKVRTRDKKAVSGYTGEDLCGFSTGNSPLFNQWVDFRKNFDGLDRLGALGLAVWYMDDGCQANGLSISSESFTRDQNQRLVELLKARFQIEAYVQEVHKEDEGGQLKTYWRIAGPVESKRRLVEICLPYIHPSMAYKFDLDCNQTSCRVCGGTIWFYELGNRAVVCDNPTCRMLQDGRVAIEKVVQVEDSGIRNVYDFTVEGNNNFFSNGFLSKNCVDELDVMPNRVAYEEAKAIPAPRDGKLPITFLTSSRKFSFGLVQEEIDKAKDTGTHIRNWNVLDVAAACPPKRHLPLLPKIPIWVNEDELVAISDEKYQSLSVADKEKYVEKEGFQGCLSNCKAFSYCQGRLAEAKRPFEGDFLKPIASVQQSIRQASLNMANAQYLCKKPSSEGLVYTHFDKGKHCKFPYQIQEMISDEPADKNLSKGELIQWLRTVEGGTWYAGYDWGFTHNFVAVLGFKYGYNLYIVDAVVEAGLDATEKVEACDKKGWKEIGPIGYPDPESPSEIKTFKKAGYQMRDWPKNAGSVLNGIEIVRTKLRPGHGREPQLYFLTEDPKNLGWDDKLNPDPNAIWSHANYVEDVQKEALEEVIKSHQLYHWKQDKEQRSTKEPDEEGADECDAARYLIMNVFPIKKDNTTHAPTPEVQNPAPKTMSASFWEQVSQDVGIELGKVTREETAPTNTRKGKWIISE